MSGSGSTYGGTRLSSVFSFVAAPDWLAEITSAKPIIKRNRNHSKGNTHVIRTFQFPLLAREPEEARPPELSATARAQLTAYVDRFNARDFDAVRDMLAGEVRLDLVDRLKMEGRDKVGQYFYRYAEATHWLCKPGFVDGHAAVLIFDPNDAQGPPTYFVLLDWVDGKVVAIRDFLFARYAMEGAEILALA